MPRVLDFKTAGQNGGKVVNPTHLLSVLHAQRALRVICILQGQPTFFYIVFILYTQSILNYSLHHEITKRIAYITFTLNVTFVLHAQPTNLYVTLVNYRSQSLFRIISISRVTRKLILPSTLPSFCMNCLLFLHNHHFTCITNTQLLSTLLPFYMTILL